MNIITQFCTNVHHHFNVLMSRIQLIRDHEVPIAEFRNLEH
jgi:hypothetical protein